MDGESAIDQINHTNQDLIIVDIMIQGIDGFQTCIWTIFYDKKVRSETGIGLAINYQIIVEKHKYHLKANSNFGRDTGFLIEITRRMQDF